MTEDELRKFLKSVELLESISDETLLRISGDLKEVSLTSGVTVFAEGEEGDAAYLVFEGTVRIESNGVELARRRVGEFVGEWALIDDEPRSASVMAETDVLLLKWDRKAFQSLLASDALVSAGISKVLLRKLREDITVQVTSALEQEVQAYTVSELRKASDRKSRFLASMFHEVRTPLAVISGHADNMLDGITGDITPRQKHILIRMKENVANLLGIANDLLRISKIEAGKMEVNPSKFDAGNLISSCCEALRGLTQPGVELRCEVVDSAREVCTDEMRMRQIVTNLVSNALKFTDAGEVDVRFSVDRGDGGEILVVEVRDTGIGIPADSLEMIFEEFQQVGRSEEEGIGLGLPIAKGLAEMLGGSLTVESVSGSGSTFTARLPAVYRA